MYFDEHMKPKRIATALRVSYSMVTQTLKELKRKLKEKLSGLPIAKQGRPKGDYGEVKKQIMEYIKEHGYYNIKLRVLRLYLLEKLDSKLVPSKVTLHKILKDTFQLKNEQFKGSQYKYSDPSFTEKRLWISRLLA